ncbi:major facilitator superfamily domain-containing protein [Abortiporus biennis]|nr:major facilitator superfamily domain-containing protein [Abortiporus biennis]
MASSSTYQPADPIISSNFSPYSSVSRVRQSRPRTDMLVSPVTPSQSRNSEREPLLGNAAVQKGKKPFYRPRPLWLVPFGIIASVVRGMTLAPRVQVFTQLSCNAIYGHDVFNHTTLSSDLEVHSSNIHLFHSSLDPAGPHLDLASFTTQAPHQEVTFIHAPPKPKPHDENEEEPDPRAAPTRRCLSDPAVQAGAAKIQTIMTTTMGVLSALTTGWWGHFGERHGRTKVLAASTLGLFLTDLTFILVSTPHSIFASHGHKLLIISPIIEGLLGGWSTLQAATSAYVSDCTSDGSRSKIFSRFTGVFFLGFSLGPTIGAYLIRHPFLQGNTGTSVHNGQPMVTSVFYIAALCSFVNMLFVLFVFPESIGKLKGKGKAVDVERDESVAANEEDSLETDSAGGSFLEKLLSPLELFKPRVVSRPEGGTRHDWSLTLVAIACFGYLLSTGIFQIKYLYAGHVYGWGAEQLSYYISFVGGLRAVHGLFIMPYLINAFKPKPKPKKAKAPATSTSATSKSRLVTRSNPLHLPSNTASTSHSHHPKKPKATPSLLVKEMQFDLTIIRLSLIIDFFSHAFVALFTSSKKHSRHAQGMFIAFTSLNSFGVGLLPGVNSFAMCVVKMWVLGAKGHGQGDPVPADGAEGGAGRLFGALALLQSVGQQILGPMMFGVIYSTTVAQFPKAIFTLAATILLVAISFVCMIQPEKYIRSRNTLGYQQLYYSAYDHQHPHPYHPHPHLRVQDLEEDEEIERGRSRISKEIRSGFHGGYGTADMSRHGSGSGSDVFSDGSGTSAEAGALTLTASASSPAA